MGANRGVSWIGANVANFARGRRGFRPEAIVLHLMDGALSGADEIAHDPASRASSHYGVGRDGAVHQYVQEPDTAFHAGVVDQPSWALVRAAVNPNFYTIGVDHEGGRHDPWPWPPAQLAASYRLVIAIARRWAIPLDGDHVITHQAIRRCRACPGEHFDHGDYIAGLLAAATGRPGGVAPGLPVRLRARARVRGAPHSAGPVLRVLSPGATFLAASSVSDGERIEGNPVWHRNPAGEFLWSGATDRPRAV
jgi:N-acetylmuramoyl-L-alanine amidase